jgi:hypothetical protein
MQAEKGRNKESDLPHFVTLVKSRIVGNDLDAEPIRVFHVKTGISFFILLRHHAAVYKIPSYCSFVEIGHPEREVIYPTGILAAPESQVA